jgi:pimeloyl-ACP methyl ester carboxylesterase
LIHGLSVSKDSWAPWIEHFGARGYKVVAIPYPGRDKSLAELRQNYGKGILNTITLRQVIDHLVKSIKALDEKPIIMGHSFGGLLTQLMVQRDLGVAAVAIDSAPPMGVLPLQWSFFRSTWPAMNLIYSSSKPWYMTFEQFQYSWVHTLPLAEQRAAYEAVIVPESRRLYRSALNSDSRVDFAKERAPLLLIGGEKDNILPARLNETNYKRYAKSPSVTDFKVFPGRTHYTVVGGKKWEEVGNYAVEWAMRAAEKDARRAVSVASRIGTQPSLAS